MTTVAKAISKDLTFDSLQNTVSEITKRITKKNADAIDSFYYSFIQKHGYVPSVYFHREYLNDWKNNRFSVIIKPRMMGKTAYYTGIDMGREDMCYNGEQTESESTYLRREIEDLRKNHLGAQTERFIEMAREGGRSEHLGNTVRELERKLENSNDAVRRLSETVAYRDNDIAKLSTNQYQWMQRAYQAERLYENLVARNKAAKKKAPAKKTSK